MIVFLMISFVVAFSTLFTLMVEMFWTLSEGRKMSKLLNASIHSGVINELIKKEDKTSDALLFISQPFWLMSKALDQTTYTAEVSLPNEDVTIYLNELQYKSLREGDFIQLIERKYESRMKIPFLYLMLLGGSRVQTNQRSYFSVNS